MRAQKFHCIHPECGRWFRIPPEAVGRRVRCPHCDGEMRIPGAIEELAAVQRAESYRVRVESGPAFQGKELKLDPDRAYTFGKSDTCDQQLPGPSVSRRHFSLHWVNNHWVLEDLNSTNGIEVDGQPVTKKELHGGETIQVGAYELQFIAPSKPLEPLQAGADDAPVATPTQAEPVSLEDDSAAEVQDAERLLREAGAYFDFKPEVRDARTQDASRRYSLSLATRLLGAAVVLALITIGSIYANDRLYAKKRQATYQPAVLPGEIIAALDRRDFRAAQTLISSWEASKSQPAAVLALARDRLQQEINRHELDLLASAEQAVAAGEWERVDKLLQNAEESLPTPLSARWSDIKLQRQQQRLVAQAETMQARGQFKEALNTLSKAEQIYPGNMRVAALLNVLRNEMGCGLLVRVKGQVKDARVWLDQRELGPPGTQVWMLKPGGFRVRVTAPRYLSVEDHVVLEPTNLAVIDVELRAMAAPPVWAMFTLQRAGEAAALWLAARHYGETGAVPAEAVETLAGQTEAAVAAKFGRTKPRFVRVVTGDGKEFCGRVVSETAPDISVRGLAEEVTKRFHRDQIGRVEELPAEHVADLVIARLRSAPTDLFESLEQLARLRWELPDATQLARKKSAAVIAEQLSRLENACAACAGHGRVTCSQCGGQKRVRERTDCPNCNGARTIACSRCQGTDRVRCGNCGGDGTIRRKVRVDRERTDWREDPCGPCRGIGQVACGNCRTGRLTCPKCKGEGAIETTGSCPGCEKGTVPCAVCGGLGAREAMAPEARYEAELAAAALGASH